MAHLRTFATIQQSTANLEVCFNCHKLGDPGEHGECHDGHDSIPLCHQCESACPLCEFAARNTALFAAWNRPQELVETGA
jgi:hypothetical protein